MFSIPAGYKFAAIAISRAWCKENLDSEIALGDDLWVLRQPPVNVAEHWQKWIGSIRTEQIEEANLWIVSTMASHDIEVVDDENANLKSKVEHFLHAVLLAGPLYHESMFVLTGANVDSVPGLRQFGEIPEYYRSHETHDFPVGNEEVALSRDILLGLWHIYDRDQHMRIRRGLGVFWRALKERFAETRLHQFVRSLEGAIKPEIGRSRGQFIHRSQLFAGRGKEAATILGECYDLRSQVEHLHDWEGAFQHISPDGRPDVLYRRVRQMEAVCRHVYIRIATSPAHRDLFLDAAIDGFWKRTERQQIQLWGGSINITTIP